MLSTRVNSSAPTTVRGAVLQRMTGLVNRPARRRKQTHYRLAIFKPNRIGDFVLSMGAIRLLVDHFGADQCVLIVSPASRVLAEREFPNTKVVMVPLDLPFRLGSFWAAMKIRRQIGGLNFSQLICLRHQRERWENLLLHWIDSVQAFGLENMARYHWGAAWEMCFVNQDAYPEAAADGLCRELEAHRTLIQRLLDKPIASDTGLPEFRSLSVQAGVNLLVSPFGSHHLRDLPPELLMDLLPALQAKFGFPIELSYGPDQMERGRALEAKLRQKGVELTPARVTSMGEYLDRVARARAVLTTETATAHIATALDLPTVVVLGGGHFGLFGPWRKSARQVWVTNRLPCFHCNWYCQEPQPYCITRVSANSILDAVETALAQSPSVPPMPNNLRR